MKRQIAVTLFVIICCSFVSTNSSLIYRADGKLICDTAIGLGPVRLKKWISIDSDLVRYMSKNVKFPFMERDMGMQLKFIYSFTVNDSAWVNNITLIGDSVKQCLGMYREAARVLRQIPACFTDALRGPKGKNYQYYLPFAFVLTDKKDSVVPGYVTIAKDIPKDPEAFSGEVH